MVPKINMNDFIGGNKHLKLLPEANWQRVKLMKEICHLGALRPKRLPDNLFPSGPFKATVQSSLKREG